MFVMFLVPCRMLNLEPEPMQQGSKARSSKASNVPHGVRYDMRVQIVSESSEPVALWLPSSAIHHKHKVPDWLIDLIDVKDRQQQGAARGHSTSLSTSP